jgi:hypothetical protein
MSLISFKSLNPLGEPLPVPPKVIFFKIDENKMFEFLKRKCGAI